MGSELSKLNEDDQQIPGTAKASDGNMNNQQPNVPINEPKGENKMQTKIADAGYNLPDPFKRDSSPDNQDLDLVNDLKENFSCHYNAVMSLVKTTVGQQEYVDQLCQISTAEGIDEETKLDLLRNGRNILEKLQEGRYIQTTPVQDTTMDLYRKIQAILGFYGKAQFEIDSPFLKTDQEKQQWNRHKLQRIESISLNDRLKEENVKLKEEFQQIQGEMNKLKQMHASEIAGLEGSNKDLQNENDKLSRKLIALKPPKPTSTIQLYHLHSGNTIKDIETYLSSLLNNQLEEVEIVKCKKPADIDQTKILIVLSILTSRVEADAVNAIKDIPCPGNTALLLFHIKESHALTEQPSADLLTNRSFKEVGGIFDMAFVNGKGIYQCDMNDHAIKCVCDFIKKGTSGTTV